MISAVAGGAAAGQPSVSSQLGGLGGDAFLTLLVAQLRFQNPMQPTDPSSMLQQTASFTQVEALKDVAKTQQQLLGLAQASIATSTLGAEVTALDATGQEVTGVVDGIRFTDAGPVLMIGDTDVSIDATTSIRRQPPAMGSAPAPTPAT